MTIGIGYFGRRDYGTIPACPHCKATDIKKKNRQQVTCGSDSCRTRQRRLKEKQQRAKNNK